MKLNMSVLYDELSVYSRTTLFQGREDALVLGCRVFHPGMRNLSNQHVYICTQADLIPIKEVLKQEPLNFICLGELNLRDVDWSVIFLKKHAQIDEIFDFLQDIFDSYNEWDSALAASITKPNAYQAILNVATRKLWNPIGLTNMAMYTLAAAGHFTDESRRWSSFKNAGYAALEDTSDQETATTTQLLNTNTKPFFVPNTRYGTQNVMAPIRADDLLCGILKTNDVNQPITEGQMYLIHCVQVWVERMAILTPIPLPISKENLVFADRLIEGQYVEADDIAFALRKRGWHEENGFLLLLCRLDSGSDIGKHRGPNYLIRLKAIQPDTIIFLKEPFIVLIRNKAAMASTELNELSTFLKKLKLRGAISMPFDNYMNLRDVYLQTASMLELKDYSEAHDSAICCIKDFYEDFILNVIRKTTSLQSICHTGLYKYARDGGDKERQHIRAFREFLVNGKNISATASSLYVHRNTLRNYLEHVQNGTGINPDEVSENEHLFLYLSCLIAEGLHCKPNGTQ